MIKNSRASQRKLNDEAIKAFRSSWRSEEKITARQETIRKCTENICTCTSVVLITTRVLYQREFRGIVEFNLAAFELCDDSLLVRVFEGLPCPVLYKSAKALEQFLRLNETNQEVKEIVRIPSADCKGWELQRLMNLIEDFVEKSSVKWKTGKSASIRALFRETQATFPDGSSMAITGFKSRFPDRPTSTEMKSMALTDKSAKVLLDKPFLDNFDSFKGRNDQFLSSLLTTKAEVQAVCQKIFADYESTKAAINTAADLGLPVLEDERLNTMVRRKVRKSTFVKFMPMLRKLSAENQLRIFATLSRKNGFAFDKPAMIDVTGIPLLSVIAEAENSFCMFEALVCTQYLPRMVVLACLFAILTETAWNVETALSLTARNIVVRGNKYLLVGIKGRTDSLQSEDIENRPETAISNPKIEANGNLPDLQIHDSTTVTAIKLLLANDEALSLSHGITDGPLFVTIDRLKRGIVDVKLLPVRSAMDGFFQKYSYEPFQLSALRKLGAHIDYLSEGGNIFTTQAKLNHSSPEVTKIYLESRLFAELMEANTRRFMRKMEASALFVCDRGDMLTERGLSQMDVQPLLFPASPSSTARSIADEWIEGTIDKFEVGVAELEHCAYQYHFYQRHHKRLIQENPLRFLRIHYPRLIFCIALRNVILTSPHSRLLKKYEGKLT